MKSEGKVPFTQLNTDGSSKKKIMITSILFMGLSHIIYFKQYMKGLLYAFIELVMLVLSPFLIGKVAGLITLGEAQPHLPVKERDNSIFMLIDGVMILAVIAIFLTLYIISVRNALSEYKMFCDNGRLQKDPGVMSNLVGKAFPVFGLAPAFILVVFFVIVPLVFSVCVAFTNYSIPNNIPPNNTVDWVGAENFATLFGGGTAWASAFGRVAVWTFVWAALATATCYFGGLLIAVVLNEYKFKINPLFRTFFILPYAVPSVVSMLVWSNLLNGTFGPINRTLQALGITQNAIPFLSDPNLAKIMCIVVNLWAGFPYFMLLSMGTMTAISQDVFEAARIDGAGKFQIFKRITLPLVLYQTAPLIIMSFTHNVNNFGAIFFLTTGQPRVADSTLTGAGGTDILVTWIYKLTVDLMKYNYASVLAVLIFVVLAPFAIWNFSRTKSYREGEL